MYILCCTAEIDGILKTNNNLKKKSLKKEKSLVFSQLEHEKYSGLPLEKNVYTTYFSNKYGLPSPQMQSNLQP